MVYHITQMDIDNIKRKLGHHKDVVLTYDECKGMLDRIEELEHELEGNESKLEGYKK